VNVLHVYRTYFPDTQGGVQEVIRQISLGTSGHGVNNRIFTPSPDPNPAVIEQPGAEVHRVKLNFEIASCGFCISGIPAFNRCVRWTDIIHYHFPWPFADVMHFATRVNKPTLMTYHSDVVRQQLLLGLYTPLMKLFLHDVTKIVCTSPNYLASSEVLNAIDRPCGVIPIGLNRKSYPEIDASALESKRERHGEGFFLFVGLLRYYKGLHSLLDAAQFTRQKIIIVGAGPIDNELRQKAKKLGLSNVHFTGYISDADKVALIKLSRAMVFPSHLRSEAFGVSLLEGAMYGKPMISAEVGTGTSYVNIDGETGLIVQPENPRQLADAINKLGDDAGEAQRMGNNALARFESLFTSRKMSEAYLHEYELLLDNRTRK